MCGAGGHREPVVVEVQLGLAGVADWLVAQGLAYDSAEGVAAPAVTSSIWPGVRAVRAGSVAVGSQADLVLLAMGFVGPEKPGLLTDLGVERENILLDDFGG